jgi:Uma2 family endonuclease
MDILTLRIPEQDQFTDDELYRFCVANKELRIERDSSGQLIIMSPVGSKSSNLNLKLSGLFWIWADAHGDLGYGFDSSAGFTLPDKSMRSPDVAWIEKSRWDKLTPEQQEKFAPLCPDFVIELRSKSDPLNMLLDKMKQWMKNGCRMAWLIDPQEEKAYVYQHDQIQEIHSFDAILSGNDILPDFKLDLSRLK